MTVGEHRVARDLCQIPDRSRANQRFAAWWRWHTPEGPYIYTVVSQRVPIVRRQRLVTRFHARPHCGATAAVVDDDRVTE